MKKFSQPQLLEVEGASDPASGIGRSSKSRLVIATVPEPTAILRQKIADLVNANALQMVTSVIEKCSGYQSVKYLFELTGIFDGKAEEDPEDESLLKLLLRRLDLPEEAADLNIPLPDDSEDATDRDRNPV
jgi:hypothetical protein